jgi:hypothetical protein
MVSKIFIPKQTEESKRFMVVYINELLGFAWFPKLLKADPVIVRWILSWTLFYVCLPLHFINYPVIAWSIFWATDIVDKYIANK